VQFCVVSFWVITTLAVLEPSYVMVSLRDEETAAWPVIYMIITIVQLYRKS